MIGRQPSSDTWVFGENSHIDASGSYLDSENESSYVWSPMCITAHCDKVSLAEIIPKLSESRSMDALPQLLESLKSATKHNYNSAILILAGAIMAFHYAQITAKYGGFPIVLAIGPTETGKSTAIKAGLSVFGMAKDAFYVEGSNGEKCSFLSTVWDR